MSKPEAALAGALSILLLCSCAGQDPASAQNDGAVESNALENAAPADPAAPGAPGTEANGVAEPVPPPDAVSHPEGYLPPAPKEPDPAGANSSGPEQPPPTTEDQHLRNGQAGR